MAEERKLLVVMSLKPGEEVGVETHPTTDQFFRVESGEGKIVMNDEESLIKDGSAVVVPAGTEHNVHSHNCMPLLAI